MPARNAAGKGGEVRHRAAAEKDALPAGSNPTIVFIQSMTWCSIVVADGADRHEVTFWLSADARKSPTTPAKLPADCT